MIVGTPSGFRYRIETVILFSDDYPAHEPIALEVGDRFTHDLDHHFYSNGRCCLWLPPATLWKPRDPDALAMFLDQLAIFYHRQLIMEADPSVPYPGPAWGHNEDGYLEYLELELGVSREILRGLRLGLVGKLNPKGLCAGGSAKQLRRCHQPPIDRFRGRVSKPVLDRCSPCWKTERRHLAYIVRPRRTTRTARPPGYALLQADRGSDSSSRRPTMGMFVRTVPDTLRARHYKMVWSADPAAQHLGANE